MSIVAKEKGLIFKPFLVSSIINGLKNQTRRLVQIPEQILPKVTGFNRAFDNDDLWWDFWSKDGEFDTLRLKAPYKIGDKIWVKENYALLGNDDGAFIDWSDRVTNKENAAVIYQASCIPKEYGLWEIPTQAEWWKPETPTMMYEGVWKPSIFMNRIFSRITLDVVSVRPERLFDISEDDAKGEGVEPIVWKTDGLIRYPSYIDRKLNSRIKNENLSAKNSFLTLWEVLNGRDSLESNPIVWRIEFKVSELKSNYVKELDVA